MILLDGEDNVNFTECVNEVLTIVKRPDKLVEAQNAVNNRLSR